MDHSPADRVHRGRSLRGLVLAVLILATGGCGSAKKDGSSAASIERGAIPPEWTASQQAPPGAPAGQLASPTPPSPPTTDTSADGTVVAAVDRYQDIISRFGGQAEVNLDFSRTAISDDDLARLPLPDSVRSIDLSVTQIGDKGLEHLLRSRRLERLNLTGTKVTESGTKTLKQMPNLWSVNLDQSLVPIETQLELMRFFASRAEARTKVRPR